MSRKVITQKRMPARKAATKSSPLDDFIDKLRLRINEDAIGDVDFVELSQEIINFDSSSGLIRRGNVAQKQEMRPLVEMLSKVLNHSDGASTFLVIDNLRKISSICGMTLISAQILDFATSRLMESNQEESVKILHSLVQCGFNETHCAKYRDRILAKFIALAKNTTDEGFYQRSYKKTVIDRISDVIYSLSHLKNLGILDAELIKSDNLLQKISNVLIDRKIRLKNTTLKSLLEVRLYCREVLKIKLDNTRFGRAQFDDATISPIQSRIFDMVIKFFGNDNQYYIEKISDPKRTIYKIGGNCKIELEGLYGRVDGQLIRSADFIIKIGDRVLFVEVDGSSHFANIDGNKRCVIGATMARNQIIKALSGCEPLVFATYLERDQDRYVRDIIRASHALAEMRSEILFQEDAHSVNPDLDADAAPAVVEFLESVEVDVDSSAMSAAAAAEDGVAKLTKPKSEAKAKKMVIQEIKDIALILLQKSIDFSALKNLLDELLSRDDIKFNALYDHPIVIGSGGEFSHETNIAEYIGNSSDPRLILLFLDYDQKRAEKNLDLKADILVAKGGRTSKLKRVGEEKSLIKRLDDMISKIAKDNKKYNILRRIIKRLKSEDLTPENLSQSKKAIGWRGSKLVKTSKASAGKEREDSEREDFQSYITDFDSANYSELLNEAIRDNDLWKVRFLMLDKKLINSMSGDQYLPIHIAAINDRVDVMRLLLDLGADPCELGLHSLNICHFIASSGGIELMECLPEDSVKMMILQKAEGDESVASIAAKSGNLDMLNFLHKHHVIFNESDLRDALEGGKLEVLEFLYLVNHELFIADSKEMIWACNRAAHDSNLSILKFLCETIKVDVRVSHDGNTLLHNAVMADKDTLEYVYSLWPSLELSIDVRNKDRETALYYAVINNKIDSVQFLVDKGADVVSAIEFKPDQKDELDLKIIPHADEGFTQYETNSIQYAAGSGYIEILKILLAHPSAKACVHRRNYIGNTILHEAARHNYLDVVEYLVLKAEMSIDVQNVAGFTPLMCTISEAESIEKEDSDDLCCDADQVIKFLCEARSGDDVVFDQGAYINRLSSDGETALSLVVKYYASNKEINHDLIRFLIENGARIDIRNDKGRAMVSAIIASNEGNALDRAIISLIIFSKTTDCEQIDNDGNTLLHMATLYDLRDLVTFLVRNKKVNINARNLEGIIPIVFARNKDMYMLLKSYNPQYPEEKEKLQKSIIAAIEYDNVEAFKEILEKLKLPLEERGNLYNQLNIALKYGSVKIIEEFRLMGFDMNLIIYDGSCKMTPLQCAVFHNSIASVEALLKNQKLDINLGSEDNMPPLLMAAKQNNAKIFSILLKNRARTDDAMLAIAEFAANRGDEDVIWKCLLDEDLVVSKTGKEYIEIMKGEVVAANPPSAVSKTRDRSAPALLNVGGADRS